MPNQLPLFETRNLRIKETADGYFLYNKFDKYIGHAFDHYGEYAQLEMMIFYEFLKPGYFVLDVGANLGANAMHFAKLVGDKGNLLAFEAQRMLYYQLCANAVINDFRQVFCHNLAVSDKPGKLHVPQFDFHRENNYGGLSLSETASNHTESVMAISIDQMQLPMCQLIKMDIEGMEYQGLQGAKNTIARFQPVLYVENDRQDKSAALMALIDSFGYKMIWHHPPLFNENNYFKNKTNYYDNISAKNLLCIPKDKYLEFKQHHIRLISPEGKGEHYISEYCQHGLVADVLFPEEDLVQAGQLQRIF